MKKGYKQNIEKLTVENNNFRKVSYTSTHSQLVLMSLKPKEDIGLEVHKDAILRNTKEAAESNEEEFEGITTE